MKLTYKYRIYPNKKQGEALLDIFELCNDLYNSALEERISFYNRYGKGVSYSDQTGELTLMKNDPNFNQEIREELLNIHSQVLQQVLKQVDTSYQNFFRRVKSGADKVGFPRFKSIDRFRSICFPQCNLISGGVKRLPNNKLVVKGIPGELKVVWHRSLPKEDYVKQIRIEKQSGKYYLCIHLDNVASQPLASTGKTLAIDLGLNTFIVADDGSSFHHPKPYKTSKDKLAHQSRKLEKKKRGSNNRKRLVKQIGRTYERITNIRTDFLHRVAKQLVVENDVIIIEKLNVKGMLEQEKPVYIEGQPFKILPKKSNIQDASWATFVALLTYKAERAGRKIIEVNPRGTSKTCSCCGNIKEDLTLKDRIYNCEICKISIDRDLNAAYNIRSRGLGISLAVPANAGASEAAAFMPQ